MTRQEARKDKQDQRRGGLGLRFWNFVDRATIGPKRDVIVGRHTGSRI
jgi:hypothetical protein